MMPLIPSEQATRLLMDWRNGNRIAADALMLLAYDKQRRHAL